MTALQYHLREIKQLRTLTTGLQSPGNKSFVSYITGIVSLPSREFNQIATGTYSEERLIWKYEGYVLQSKEEERCD